MFRSLSGTARGVKVYEQQFIVSDSLDCIIPAVIYTRVTNRNILAWIKQKTGNKIMKSANKRNPLAGQKHMSFFLCKFCLR